MTESANAIEVRRYRVSGVVQGVGFRWFVREEARALGLRGWVRNEPTGDVLLEVAGDIALLERLVDALRSGPPASQVAAVLAEMPETTEAGGLPTPFAVRR